MKSTNVKPRDIIELSASKETKPAATAAAGSSQANTVQSRLNAALQGAAQAASAAAPSTPARPGASSGAAAAAGVLTAVDEDEEGVEEAPVPDDFTYETEGEDEEL